MPNPKINDAEARELRILHAIGTSTAELAELYRISLSTTRSVIHGFTHVNAGGPVDTPKARADYHPRLTPELVRELRVMRATMRLSFQALAEEYGIGESAAQSAVHGKTYPDAGGPIEEVGTCENWTKRQPAAHGRGMYQKGCRCEVCAAENKKRCKEWRERTGYGTRGVHRDA